MNGLEGKYVIKNNKKLALGYTTGSCAAAAAKAATLMCLTGKKQERILLSTPKGILLRLDVEDICFPASERRAALAGLASAHCAVRKDAGDDPDVTDRALVCASVYIIEETGRETAEEPFAEAGGFLPDGRWRGKPLSGVTVFLDGGIGVGRVTKPGLEQPVGAAAINRIPRQMIVEAVSEACLEYGWKGEAHVEISVPEGEALAARTFNPRLGIIGGISILGTSGIVEPMSEAALLASIRLEMQMKRSEGADRLVVVPGNYGADYLSSHLRVSRERAVKCSNFIGEAVDMAAELGYQSVLFVSHIGKFIKVAGGIMNTHSRSADARMEILCAHALKAGAGRKTSMQILDALTTDEGLRILKEAGLLRDTMERLLDKIVFYLEKRSYERLKIAVVLFSNAYGELGRRGPVEEFLNCPFADNRK